MNSYPNDINSEVSILSLNMHGANQALLFLDSACSNNHDVIFLQETWLSSDSMLKTFHPFSNDYHIFPCSELDTRQTLGILKGMPFGGLCTFVHKSFCNRFSDVNCIAFDNNFIILKLDHLLLINVYLPSSKTPASLDNLL